MTSSILWSTLCASAAFALDRASKGWVLRHFATDRGAHRPGSLLRPTWNRHPTLGGPASRRRLLAGWLTAAGAVAAMLCADGLLTDGLFVTATSPAALGIALGGAAGNLRDHWRHGAVFDFLDLRTLVDRPPFGVCNFADAAILGGLGLFFCNEIAARLTVPGGWV